jgi:3D (Asp-Asp-Asp) domain-containing protein
MNIINKTNKIGLITVALSFAFFSFTPGALVEGSPSVIINDSFNDNLEQESSGQAKEPYYDASNNTFLSPINRPFLIQIRKIFVTAYSSTPDQTEGDPFITASGARVYDGTLAANFLPFGTKVRLPEVFGDKIFTVEDRMNARFRDTRIDIWFPDRSSAKEFGIQETIMEILDY